MRSTTELAASAFVLALVACANVNSVVGGACADGYVEQDNTCVPASAVNNGDGGLSQTDGQTNGDGNNGQTGDGGDGGNNGNTVNVNTYTGPSFTCPPPTILCSGVCVDPTSDPDNCGSCGHVCPSNSCVSSTCVGSAPGHVVVIGHDYTTSPSNASSQARVLSNATFIPASNPLRVMSYEEYSNATAVKNAEALVDAEAKLLGRTVTFVATTSSSTVSSTIDVTTYDVLLVHDQDSAPSGTLGTIGTSWDTSGTIATFLHAGGVVIVLTGGTGTAEMPALTTNANLLSITAQATITGRSPSLLPPTPSARAW